MLASCGLPLHTCVLLFYVLLDCCCPCPTWPAPPEAQLLSKAARLAGIRLLVCCKSGRGRL